jgi:glycosidase
MDRFAQVRTMFIPTLISLSMLSSEIPAPPASVYAKRLSDWRNGAVVYHVFVDRFAPALNLESKRETYASPRKLKRWDELPTPGTLNVQAGMWSHELEFWGGDLPSLRSKLGHIVELGADVLYLNPIQEAFSNHKYDATDWKKIDPAYGSEADFKGLISDLKGHGKRLVIDGVFNHVGRRNVIFQQALKDEKSPYRDWFVFGKEYPNGYRGWAGVANLPEVRLENPQVQDYVWNRSDSVVAHFLNMGVDGWRLDVASELGFDLTAKLTKAAHKHKPGSLVTGEAWTYPSKWTGSMDALMNIYLGQLLLMFGKGELTSRQLGSGMTEMVQDVGLEPLLKSWIVLSNHDMPRLANVLPQDDLRRMVTALQFTLPGSPQVYYGDEVAMLGGGDPSNRAPMRWDLVQSQSGVNGSELTWTKSLIKLNHDSRALKVGDYRTLVSDHLFAFKRSTDNPLETVIVVANPTATPITETVLLAEPTLLGYTLLQDQLTMKSQVRVISGTIRPTVPPRTVQVYKVMKEGGQYPAQYKRIRTDGGGH